MNFFRGLAGFLLTALLPTIFILHTSGIFIPEVTAFQVGYLPASVGETLTVFYAVLILFFIVGLTLLGGGNKSRDTGAKG